MIGFLTTGMLLEVRFCFCCLKPPSNFNRRLEIPLAERHFDFLMLQFSPNLFKHPHSLIKMQIANYFQMEQKNYITQKRLCIVPPRAKWGERFAPHLGRKHFVRTKYTTSYDTNIKLFTPPTFHHDCATINAFSTAWMRSK